MGKQVQIQVKGIQTGTTGEEITTTTRGTMLYKEPYYYVSYEEKIDKESEQSSKTVLRFSERELRVTRKGEVESTLEFLEGSAHNSLYMTGMGNFEVALFTDRLSIDCHERGAHLEADYRIGLNSMPPASGKLSIHIEALEI
ncbi:MAG: DUF1934 domain-containing protein [Lachnospiraceae bacterium]|nr:DUF1934 domain-containing protein [Lachnospiraceae bacterium]